MKNTKSFNNKILNATKWSSITQILAKIITPITNMILARILAPEAFGVIATLTMIVSFVEMFTDSGFQKYLIQREFKSNEELKNSANVAFWSNLTLAILLWAIISHFNEEIAVMVGNPGLGIVIVVACIQLPLSSFSSIQMALYRRDFDFKTLFNVRVIGIFIPLIVTIPLALMGFDYWSLVIGIICLQLFNAVYLTVKSSWKPSFFYDFKLLKNMFSFSVWSLIEAISIWLTSWIDAFIIAYFLNQYYLGIYKTSTVMVNSLLSLVTAAIIPVLFSTLSRLQDDDIAFKAMFYKFQKNVAILILPLGVGVYLYSDLATYIMLGSQWSEASEVIGLWALTSVIMIVFGHFSSEVYRSKGKPKLSFIAQLLHLIVLVPTVIISAGYGFWPLVYARSWIRIQFVLVHFLLMKYFMGFSIIKTVKNILPSIIAVVAMSALAIFLQSFSMSILWNFISICISGLFYFIVIITFPRERQNLLIIFSKAIPVKFKRGLKNKL